jgi:serine/threonine protein kinase
MAVEKIQENIAEEETTQVQIEDGDEEDVSYTEYTILKNPHHKIRSSGTKDLVDGRYLINPARPLEHLHNNFAKAYQATDKLDPNKELICFAMDKRHPVRLHEINKLLHITIPNFSNVLGAELIPSSIGKGNFYCIIVEKPKGITLREFVRLRGPIPEVAITSRIVPSINNALAVTSKHGITHGKINPDNIYIAEDGSITVGECISELCGASQPMMYETLDRATALPMAKGNGHFKSDYYAMGVLVIFLITGRPIRAELNDQELLELKFRQNTYHVITHNLKLSVHLMDLLRGVVNDKVIEIWSSTNVSEWSKGRSFNLLPPATHTEASRPILFMGERYHNKRHLAHAFYTNWEEAKAFLRQDDLLRWIERSIQDDNLAEKLFAMARRGAGGISGTDFDKDDELLLQYIMFLDPAGPFRLKNVSANVDGVGPLLAHAIMEEDEDIVKNLTYIIRQSFITLWHEGDKFVSGDSYHEASFALQKSSDFIKKKNVGFGAERCLYSLNPSLPCQSEIVLEDAVFSPGGLLIALDKNDSIDVIKLDNHLGAFLTNRLDLPTSIKIKPLARFPDFSIMPEVQALAILAFAQQASDIFELPGLAKKMGKTLDPVVANFNSNSIRKELASKLEKGVNKGSLMMMIKILSEPKYLMNDRLGFRRAADKYRNNAIQILRLSNKVAINNVGYRYGLQLSVMVSFFLAAIVVVILIMKSV